MVRSIGALLGRAAVPAALAAAVAVPLSLPAPAHAYWRGGVWIAVPPVVVTPPAYSYYPPAYSYPYAYGYGYGYHPRRFWVPAHWRGGYWVPGHWG